MTTEGYLRQRARIAVLVIALLWLLPHAAFAHAVLMRSTPAEHATVKAGDLDVRLTYNSRIDASRSALTLVGPDGKQQTLTLSQHMGPNLLVTRAAVSAQGAYKLQWQVLASDGHITRGVVDFRVQ